MAYRGIKDWAASKAQSLVPTPKPRRARRIGYREMVETMIGRRLRGWQVVHHVDEDRSNNDPSNLMVTTKSTHMKIHAAKKKL